MDLEIIELIDFSAGDHEHLIRKAADDNVQTKSNQSYQKSSPSFGPQKIHGKPYSKTGPQEETYVVPISDETMPSDSSAIVRPFSEASVRRGEKKEFNFWGEKSKCSLKMFLQSGLSKRVTFAFSFSQSCCTVKHGGGSALMNNPQVVQGI